jgi:hypothetical protein
MAAKPGVEFESPFLSNEVLARKSDRSLEARAERLASRSPFLSEPGFAAAGEGTVNLGRGLAGRARTGRWRA